MLFNNYQVLRILLRTWGGAKYALIAGAPFFMSSVEKELAKRGIVFVYAYSNRVSVEQEIDGKIEKNSMFKHQG